MDGDDSLDGASPHPGTTAVTQRTLQLMAGMLGYIPVFTGSDKYMSAKQFFENVDTIGAMAEWTDSIKIMAAKAKMKNSASEFLSESPDTRNEASYQRFKDAIIRRFDARLPMTVRMQKFTSCVQRPGEKVVEYVARLKGLAHDYLESIGLNTELCKDAADKIKLTQFLNGINNKVRAQIAISQPATLEEALRIAELHETNEFISGKQINSIQTQGNPLAPDSPSPSTTDPIADLCNLMTRQMAEHEAAVNALKVENNDLQQRLREAANHQQEYQGRVSQAPACYNCNEPNHFRANCPYRQNEYRNPNNYNQPRQQLGGATAPWILYQAWAIVL